MSATTEHRPHSASSIVDEACVRLFDILGATILLVVAAPLILVVAVAVKLDSPGPVLFRCRRVGRNGHTFDMLKFRKMHDDAAGSALTVADDDRLTRVGAILTRFKLDEIPQVWNVLKGEMSLVGPRPEDPEFVSLQPGAYAEILSVSPGISGLSQLAFTKEPQILDPEDRTADYLTRLFPQKVALDQMYASRRSVRMNIKILAWTVIAMLGHDVAVHRETGRVNLRRRPQPTPETATAPQPMSDYLADQVVVAATHAAAP